MGLNFVWPVYIESTEFARLFGHRTDKRETKEK